MTDIVERLRSLDITLDDAHEAAAEIERLRAENERVRSIVILVRAENRDLQAKIDTLVAQLDAASFAIKDLADIISPV